MDKQILSHTWAAHIVGTQGKSMPYIIGYLCEWCMGMVLDVKSGCQMTCVHMRLHCMFEFC